MVLIDHVEWHWVRLHAPIHSRFNYLGVGAITRDVANRVILRSVHTDAVLVCCFREQVGQWHRSGATGLPHRKVAEFEN
jgi:hypothetical protein